MFITYKIVNCNMHLVYCVTHIKNYITKIEITYRHKNNDYDYFIILSIGKYKYIVLNKYYSYKY